MEIRETVVSSGWFLLTADAATAVRVGPGTHLGEDTDGELSFDAADAQIGFELGEQGELLLSAESDRIVLEQAPAARVRSISLPPHTCAEIEFAHSVVAVAEDFALGAPGGEALRIRVIDLATVVPEPVAGPAAPSVGPAPRVDEPTVGASMKVEPSWLHKLPWPSRSMAHLGPQLMIAMAVLGLLLYAVQSVRLDLTPASPDGAVEMAGARPAAAEETAESPSELAADQRVEPAEPVVEPGPGVDAVDGPVLEGKAVAAGEVVGEGSGVAEETAPVESPSAGPAPPSSGPEGAEAADIASAPRRPVPLSQPVLDVVLRPESAARSLDSPAQPVAAVDQSRQAAPVPEPAIPEPRDPPAADGAEASSLASAEASAPDRIGASIPEDGEGDALALETGPATLDSIVNELQDAVTEALFERDLRNAGLALAAGVLMPPDRGNAFELYRRALDARPGSERARAGLQAVGEAVLALASLLLEADDLVGARGVLDRAGLAGADPERVATLAGEIEYRRHVLEAETGSFSRIYNLADLQIVDQPPLSYPRYAPRGVDGAVELEMTVSATGAVTDIDVVGEPPPYFERAARRSVEQWKFAPVTINGKPVPVRTAVRVVFRG